MKFENKNHAPIKIREIISGGNTLFLNPGLNISELSKIMQLQEVSVFPVGNENKVSGIITERDVIVRVLAKDLDPHQTLVSEVMSQDIASCSANDNLEDAIDKMYQRRVSNLVVKNNYDKIIGVVSLKDIIQQIACENTKKGCLKAYIKDIV